MTRRAWILALEIGLCGSLSACTTPGTSGTSNHALVASSKPADTEAETEEKSSPYAVIPQQEKTAKSSKPAISNEELASRSPYSAFAHGSQASPVEPPEPSTKLGLSAEELALRSPYGGFIHRREAPVAEPIASAPPPEPPPPEPPEPPPPEPPAYMAQSTPADLKESTTPAAPHVTTQPDLDSPGAVGAGADARSPYAAILSAPPLAAKTIPGQALPSTSISPYAQSVLQPVLQTAGNVPRSRDDKTPLSPYAAISDQQVTTPATKPLTGRVESPSPYAAKPLEAMSAETTPSFNPTLTMGSPARTLTQNVESPSPYAATPGKGTPAQTTPSALAESRLKFNPTLITNSSAKVSTGKTESSSPYAAIFSSDTAAERTPRYNLPLAPQLEESEVISQLRSAKSPEQPELHLIQGTSNTLSPQVDLDVVGEAPPTSEGSIPRKGDEPPLLTAMRCFLNKHPTEALRWLKRYDEPNQDLLLRMMPLMARLAIRDMTRDDAEKAVQIMEELNNLTGIPVNGDLVISKLCLCKHIKTFGDYEPFPEDHAFQPHDLLWIYAEVRNFTSDRRDLGNGEIVYETRLKTIARITNSAGTHEWPLSFDRRYGPDRSRTLRHDYWDNLSFNVPDLPPGAYTLWLKVVDEPTSRVKERSIDFQVVPPKGQ